MTNLFGQLAKNTPGAAVLISFIGSALILVVVSLFPVRFHQ